MVPNRVDINLAKTVDEGTLRSHDRQGQQPNSVARDASPVGSAVALNKQRQIDSWEHVARNKKSWHSRWKKRGKTLFDVEGEQVAYDPEEMTDLVYSMSDDEEFFCGDEIPDLEELEAFFRRAGLEQAAPRLALLLFARWAAKSYERLARAAKALAPRGASGQQSGNDSAACPLGSLSELRGLFAGMGFTDEASSFVIYHAVMGYAADFDIQGAGHITSLQLAGGVGVPESVAATVIGDWNATIYPDAAPSCDRFDLDPTVPAASRPAR